MNTELINQLAKIDFDFGLTQAVKSGTPLEPALQMIKNRPHSDSSDYLRLAAIGLFLEQRDPKSNWPSERLQALEQWHLIFWEYLYKKGIMRYAS